MTALHSLRPLRASGRACSSVVLGWVASVFATVVAAATRLIGLGHPSTLMFDEIYYAKDGWSLWHVGYEATWGKNSDAAFASGDVSSLTTQAAYVVHPPLGKWLIGLGEVIVGPGNAIGWRIVPAIAGILTVLILCRVTMRLTRSPLLTLLAGFFLAIDGVGISESRIALLDVFISLFATAALYFLVRDHEDQLTGMSREDEPARRRVRPWLVMTGVSIGLACSVKWSGLYLLAAVGLLVAAWDLSAIRRAGGMRSRVHSAARVLVGDFLRLVPVAAVVYVGSWWSWFAHAGAWKHGWAAGLRAQGQAVPRAWLPDSVNDFIAYHQQAYSFHVALDSPHPYMSHPVGWLLQWRPTNFYWVDQNPAAAGSCGAARCVAQVNSIGTVPLWWAAIPALVIVVVLAWVRRDWRAWVPLIGYVGLYLPWFLYPRRTIFTFYTVAFEPMVMLTLALALGVLSGTLPSIRRSGSADELGEAPLGQDDRRAPDRGPIAVYLGFDGLRPVKPSPSRAGLWKAFTGVEPWRLRREGLVLIAMVLALAIAFDVLWWPLWTGQLISYDFWLWHMWLPSWI